MEKSRLCRLVWGVVLSGACICGPLPAAQAQGESAVTTQARELFQSGVEHYEASQFAQALADFERAYALKPHPMVQVNIANCYDKMNHPAEALSHFEAFLASSEGSPAQRDEVRAAVARLAMAAGRLSIRATPAGAQGVIDRQRTAKPLQWVSVGHHRIDVTAADYEPAVRVVDVRPGQTVEVQVDLTPKPTPTTTTSGAPTTPTTVPVAERPTIAPATPAITAAPPVAGPVATAGTLREPADKQPGLPANVWISGGATFGLGVIAVVTGQLALAANREFDTNLNALRNTALSEYQRAGAWARGVDAADRADALAAVTDILLAFTFVGAGLTTYFYLADRNESEQKRLRVALRTGTKSGQLELRGHF